MTDTKALRDLLAAATPGEWEVKKARFDSGERELIVTFAPHNLVVAEVLSDETWTQDAAFIAAAHNALPALLDEVDALRAERDKLRTQLTVCRKSLENELKNEASLKQSVDALIVDGCEQSVAYDHLRAELDALRAYKAAHELEGGE